MTFTKLAAAAALALCFSASSALADVGPADAARMKSPREVIRIVTPESRWDEMLQQMGKQMMGATAAQGAKLPPDFMVKMEKVLDEAIPYDDMVNWSAEIYAKRFTTQELTGLRSFYKTPLGMKLAGELPGIMGEVARDGHPPFLSVCPR